METGAKMRRKPFTGHFYGQLERDYCEQLQTKEAKGLVAISLFELLFIFYLGLAPTVYDLKLLEHAPEVGRWQWRLTMVSLASMVPAINVFGLRLAFLKRHQDVVLMLGGFWLVLVEAFVLHSLPKGMPREMFGLHLIMIVSCYITPATRYVYSRTVAWFGTLVFVYTYLSLDEYPSVGNVYFAMLFMFMMANAVGMLVGGARDRMMRQLFLNSLEIDVERRQSARLVANILPAAVAQDLAAGGMDRIAATIPDASILFADIVGFTSLARTVPASTLVDHLSHLFSRFDALTEEFQVEKIKTIGDAYMAAGGVPDYRHDHLQALVRMAFKMQGEMAAFGEEHGLPLQLRIGIHTGSVVAGVLGTKKFSYDLWGETVNFASRLEASALPGTIQVSETVAQILKNDFVVTERGSVDLKGMGQTKVFVVSEPPVTVAQKAA